MRRTTPVRARRSRIAIALLALAALVCIDCLNVIQSEAWTDLTRTPHLAAVSRAKDGHKPVVLKATPNPLAATVPAPLDLVFVCLVLGIGLEVARAPGVRLRLRQPSRAPPALRFRSSARS